MDCLRVFVAGTADITVVVPAPGVEDAYDILVGGGVAPQKAADLAVGFEKIGADPIFQAKKFLRLRQVVLDLDQSTASSLSSSSWSSSLLCSSFLIITAPARTVRGRHRRLRVQVSPPPRGVRKPPHHVM